MSATPTSPKPALKGQLTVKVISCHDLEKNRLLSKMDPYAKVEVGSESFKTKTHENGDRAPKWDQAFLFNLTGAEADLHVKVYDSETLSDTYIGRTDLQLMTILASGGGEKNYDLFDPENFRKVTGKISLQVSFSGEGGPDAAAELAPISGLFHFQHNATGFLVHTAGEKLLLKAGGINDAANSFEWQGPYIRYVPNSAYVTGLPDGTVALKAGISQDAKWKWTGIGLQHVASGKLLHPTGDAFAAGTVLVLTAGATAASGFSLIQSTPVAAAASSVAPPPATNPHAASAQLPNVAALSIATPPASGAYPNLSAGGAKWHCAFCTYENSAAKSVCEMCSKSRSGGGAAVAHAVFDLDRPAATWPAQVQITSHPHPLFKLPTIYKGTYNCDNCALQGQGTVYHCEPCQFDVHPACAHQKQKH